MATKVITVDDIDGYDGDDVARRDFELGGVTYTIDLGDANFEKLQELLGGLAPFVEKAQPTKGATRSRRASADSAPRLNGGYSGSDVRQWAIEQGIEVSARGKIADEVYEQFVAAHPDAKSET